MLRSIVVHSLTITRLHPCLLDSTSFFLLAEPPLQLFFVQHTIQAINLDASDNNPVYIEYFWTSGGRDHINKFTLLVDKWV